MAHVALLKEGLILSFMSCSAWLRLTLSVSGFNDIYFTTLCKHLLG